MSDNMFIGGKPVQTPVYLYIFNAEKENVQK